ncbi:MAG: cytochrome ubiquinol oxidase subunit I [Thermoguttaceae bacterium]|nr:cytochrome ubiquinol oxidase subunit I [Thermoguttaceae bacterium]
MHYPWWYVSGLTSPMLIAIVAVVHVIVSHYAVGGGILLAVENRYAIRTEDGFYRDYWKSHAKFFVLLTVVFGAITGVGIWWTIGLASPLATEMLIRTFVFGWAIEWCFFVMEIVAAFAFYYYWDKLPAKTHSIIGFIYALAAWISLVLITGITSFMLNSQTLLGTLNWENHSQWPGSFWQAFCNEQFLPQTVARTGGALILATFYVYLHATLFQKNDEVREMVIRRMKCPSIVGLVFVAVGTFGWYWFLTPSSRMMLERAAAMNIFLGLFAAVLVAMLILMIVGPFRSPRNMSTGLALALFMFGVVGISVGEFVREAVRKPFIVDQFVYGHQIYAAEVDAIRQKGLLESGHWTSIYLSNLQKKYPNLKIAPEVPVVRGALAHGSGMQLLSFAQSGGFQPVSGHKTITSGGSSSSGGLAVMPQTATSNKPAVASSSTPLAGTSASGSGHEANTDAAKEGEAKEATAKELPEKRFFPAARVFVSGSVIQGNTDLLRVSAEDRVELGHVVFMYHCNDCHAAKWGYSAAGPMLTGKTKEEIARFVQNLNRPGFYMPPWCGTEVEAELLADYLVTIRPEMPENMTIQEEVQQ